MQNRALEAREHFWTHLQCAIPGEFFSRGFTSGYLLIASPMR